VDNLLEQAVNKGVFNGTVHEQTENGDPKRNTDGSIQLKTNWKKIAQDRQGRTFNPHVHGDEPKLDDEGYLKVRRREAKVGLGNSSRTRAALEKIREPGYAYYLANDEGGRVDQLTENDWEPVMTKEGRASMKVGQARQGNTEAIWFKKPQEWYDEDQKAKVERNKARQKQTRSPKADSDQYEATADSPLR